MGTASRMLLSGLLMVLSLDAPAQEQARDGQAHHHDAAATPPAVHDDAKVSVDAHIPPDPAQHPMAPMSDAEMTRAMEMDDTAKLFMFKLDTFERAKGDHAYSTAWNARAWYGGDFDKLLLRSEGEREHGKTDARIEALWNHAFASFWDWQLGLRHDAGNGPSRDWAAFGVQGLAPYWFEIEATAYVGDGGRAALGFRAEYELLLSQRLILQAEIELNLYGRGDRARAVAAGLSDAELGLRLRYEIRRELAPYIGVVRKYRRGVDGHGFGFGPVMRSETQVVVGLRLWF
ncbi:MAG: copper resistance protein B [Proteobacteria bacterium]|uniref:copper resistance protein B n=1 Tax=Rudaea sp. TaxID=2136325 RepID=UPI00378430C2|nr:copper resistance protein B [Pseudomonadota bacterium]